MQRYIIPTLEIVFGTLFFSGLAMIAIGLIMMLVK